MANTPEILDHKEWLGYLQPVGLVVSPPALVRAQAIVNRNVAPLQQTLLEHVEQDPEIIGYDGRPHIKDFPSFAQNVLGWTEEDLVRIDDEPDLLNTLEVMLTEYNEALRPTYVVPDFPEDGGDEDVWLMLIMEVSTGTDLDAPSSIGTGWHGSPQARLERLLRETEHDLGLLVNGTDIRLVYAPRGETSGHITFPIEAMCEVQGRLILGAFRMLLEADRLFDTLPRERRLPALLKESRQYQNEVSTKLADQVLQAMIELLQGFQAADASSTTTLLETGTEEQRQHIYGGLLTTLMRTVFLLYAEDRGLMPEQQVYVEYYSVSGLFDRLRVDVGRYPDTMDQRFGAWAQLVSLFRLVYDGGQHGDMKLPRRHGQLFDPNEYPFLEGRRRSDQSYVTDEPLDPPRVSDGVVFRVLQNLLIVDGERLSYRTLDVEQIGSVYEAMMGFSVEVATGPSIGVRPHHVVVDLADLLETKSKDRKKELKVLSGCDVTGQALKGLKDADTVEELVAAFGKKTSSRTPRILPPGALFLQPGEERRKTGSHYTPRSLTEPIVKTTLRPIFEGLGKNPTPKQILDLKVCDPAMGSGAFLVEACRQLAEKLVEAWEQHDCMPSIPADEDPLLHARRLVAQRCIYGVDKNPFAVNLAKLSLWLATLAKDHTFTFLDHALKCGDSLVGLSYDQIAYFELETKKGQLSFGDYLNTQLVDALQSRQRIHELGDENEIEKKQRWKAAEDALDHARLLGDLYIYTFFSESKKKAREDAREAMLNRLQLWREGKLDISELRNCANEMREWEKPVMPFHWEIEFPEVFQRRNGGFDAFVGNPPFLGGTMISTNFTKVYLEYLTHVFIGSGNRMDLVAYFFRRSFSLLNNRGAMGLISTNTVAQGDTRKGGLSYICKHGGLIYEVQQRLMWPGQAAVVVSVVHIVKGEFTGSCYLNGKEVKTITAFLFHAGGHDDPKVLRVNKSTVFGGVKHYGDGFLFEDGKEKATPVSEMYRLLDENSNNRDIIWPFIGGRELNSHPLQKHSRYIINFGTCSKEEARQWPELLSIVENKVRSERQTKAKDVANWPWWVFWRPRRELYQTINEMDQVIVNSQVSSHLAFAFQPTERVFSHALNVFALGKYNHFCVLQSRPHEIWARFFGSSMKDDLRYTPSDCFETFPFPKSWEENASLEAAGDAYYTYRADLMVRNDEGLTKTYNRFHDPEEQEPNILKLRELHAAMDRAVLDAYGWHDIPTDCEFLLDYEEEDEGSSKRKKPWRYRWPNEVHDEVLARLLELNQQRAEEEELAGKGGKKKAKKKSSPRKKAKKPEKALPLFQQDSESPQPLKPARTKGENK